MNIKFRCVVGVFTVIVLGLACKKETSSNNPSPGEFLNNNVGSTWDYSVTGSNNAEWKVSVEDSILINNAKNFQLFKSNFVGSGAIARNYYRYANGNYSTLVKDADGINQEIVYLKDSTQAGKNWSKSIKGSGGVLQDYQYKVIETTTKSVSGVNYDRVVHVQLTIPNLGYTAEAYYAPKVGLIQLDENYASSGSDYHTLLKSHNLK